MTKEQTALDIARRMAELGERSHAVTAYTLALADARGRQPETELEAALYLFENGGNYKVAYDAFRSLYRRGFQRETLLELMTQAFYQPNIKLLKSRYEKNCRLLRKYPYCFQQDFPAFEELPLRFYPYDDQRYIPFTAETETFGEPLDLRHPVVSRNFFQNLDKPVLAADVYSQYELEYLRDNVRKSEWVGRENHVYLHYTDWGIFCAYLQVLNLRPLLAEEKLVFLIGDEISQYPIDFQARFGMDYSQYPVKPVGIREIHRLIWHTQLSAHNGGDFFNEIFYGHPNLLAYESLMLDEVHRHVTELKDGGHRRADWLAPRLRQQLNRINQPTEKDLLVALFLNNPQISGGLDPRSRIAPALFFQPHFHNIFYEIRESKDKTTPTLYAKEYEQIRTSPMFLGFPYIKTFTPMRRPTTSYAASVRFSTDGRFQDNDNMGFFPDLMAQRLLNRSYLIDPRDRLYRDSVLVRFEDGKLNPTATFTALAEFLDLPYTESMTYCSSRKGIDPESLEGNARGFDPATVYRTYDEFANDEERAFLEYFLRDAYEYYGYDFHYYKGDLVDDAWIEEKLGDFTCLDSYIEQYYQNMMHKLSSTIKVNGEIIDVQVDSPVPSYTKNRRRIVDFLLRGLHFTTPQGQPLKMMKPLKLDPALLEQPLYH